MNFEQFRALLNSPFNIFYFICSLIAGLCTLATLAAVAVDFASFHKRQDSKKEKKSIVDTSTMLLFFFYIYLIIRFNFGRIEIRLLSVKIILAVIGVVLLLVGCAVNIRGRLQLGSNWSNQVRIFRDQTLVTTGVYGFVRHPLYASIIWMFFGASLLYLNIMSLLSTIFIFVPFMMYRARQEERLLFNEFEEYASYLSRVGMFFPKLLVRKK